MFVDCFIQYYVAVEDGYCLNLTIISFDFFVLLISDYMYLSKNGIREPPYTDIKRSCTSVPY